TLKRSSGSCLKCSRERFPAVVDPCLVFACLPYADNPPPRLCSSSHYRPLPPMCTVVILRRPDAAWPVLFASNRAERAGRPWGPPGHHWPDRAEVVAGRDDLAGGSWLGVNKSGVVAAILNRHGTLGPAPGLRSRGELVLEALDHHDAADAAKALGALD